MAPAGFCTGAVRETLVLELESQDFHVVAKMTHRISHSDKNRAMALSFSTARGKMFSVWYP